ncbi:twin-arginine translocation signal domain-containing protein, partial [Salmonella enterica]|nr:twin-arginine translocation signal domain-containing protein [Salmonella enterica]
MDRCEEERLIEVPVSRRKLIQAGATTGLMAAVGGLSLPFSFTSQAANKTAIVEDKA